jgi:hypothetical protein
MQLEGHLVLKRAAYNDTTDLEKEESSCLMMEILRISYSLNETRIAP